MPRRRSDLIARGDVWDADIPGVGVHPVVIVTRDVAEVEVGPDHGLSHESAGNTYSRFTLPKAVLTRRRGHLGEPTLSELDLALSIALGLR